MRTEQLIDDLELLAAKHKNDKYFTFETRWIDVLEAVINKLRELDWHTGTPTEREWVLGIFREADTGWINPVPFVCEYLQGLKTKGTTEEGWIIKNCTDIDQPCDYYKKLQCIAWQKIEPYKEKEDAKSNYDF